MHKLFLFQTILVFLKKSMFQYSKNMANFEVFCEVCNFIEHKPLTSKEYSAIRNNKIYETIL